MSSLLGVAVAVVATSVLRASTSTSSSLKAKEKSAHGPAPIHCRDGTTVIPYKVPAREEQLNKLKKNDFDLLVVGGGCVGTGVAHDAARRGLRVALIEAEDFAAGTTSRSTKLIHGGIRYLETAFKKLDKESLHLVMEALQERAYMLKAAPYMNKPLPIMIPIYKWWEIPYMWAGCQVYDLIAGGDRAAVPSSHFMGRDEALFNFPMLRDDGLKGAIIYYDGQMNDARMCLVIALTATQEGAVCVNRVKAMGLLKDDEGKVRGAKVKDTMTGEEWEVPATAVVNATGCFADALRKMDDPEAQELIIPAAGVHVMLPDHFSPANMGLIVPETTDGRVLFFLPWEGGTIAGTTDSESGLTMLPRPTAEEVNFIITESNRYLKSHVSHGDAIAAWSGLRPLVRDPKKMVVRDPKKMAKAGEGGGGEKDTKALSRNHVIEVSKGNLVSILGGKWTTYRSMAQDTVDAVLKAVPEILTNNSGDIDPKCTTLQASLIGADRMGVVCDQKFDVINVTLRNEYLLPKDVANHLVRNYGTRALQIAEIVRTDPQYSTGRDGEPRRLVRASPFLEAEVVFAVEQEYALTAVDVLARRTRLAFVDAESARLAAPRVIEIMGNHFQWNKRRRQKEAKEVEEFLETMSPQPIIYSRRGDHKYHVVTPPSTDPKEIKKAKIAAEKAEKAAQIAEKAAAEKAEKAAKLAQAAAEKAAKLEKAEAEKAAKLAAKQQKTAASTTTLAAAADKAAAAAQ